MSCGTHSDLMRGEEAPFRQYCLRDTMARWCSHSHHVTGHIFPTAHIVGPTPVTDSGCLQTLLDALTPFMEKAAALDAKPMGHWRLPIAIRTPKRCG